VFVPRKLRGGGMNYSPVRQVRVARIRKIPKSPTKDRPNYFLVDACFLAEKYLPLPPTATPLETARKTEVTLWWKEIDRQLSSGKARVYVPDICIAESFKVLAKKRYQDGLFKSAGDLRKARQQLSRDITLPHTELKKQKRRILYHDLPTSRDIIIAIDRFYELFMKHRCNVGVIDLLVVASAKYLMDYHDALRGQLHIITMDNALWRGTK
jgi:hypothetical protein